jgi:ATP-dependent helicase/nuclease subunit B
LPTAALSAASNIFTIPASAPFAETLARGLVDRLGTDPLALSAATIYLPTRRAVRTLADTFARVLGGAALLPDIKPLGDVDEDDLLLGTSPEELCFATHCAATAADLLARLVRRWIWRSGHLTPRPHTAASLASLIDEVGTQGLSGKGRSLASESLARYRRERLSDHRPELARRPFR